MRKGVTNAQREIAAPADRPRADRGNRRRGERRLGGTTDRGERYLRLHVVQLRELPAGGWQRNHRTHRHRRVHRRLHGHLNRAGTIVVHRDGSANFHDVEVFTGTVNGVPGTVTFNLTGSNDSALNVKARSTILSATGELSGLTGLLRLAGSVKFPEGPFGTYSGQIG